MESRTDSSSSSSSLSPSKDLTNKCCDCVCHSPSTKRRHDESSEPQNPKVHIENECELLRETVTSQQQSIQELQEELEKERNAASSAADESMNVMQRLQHEKAELQMELRQYKDYAGEKMEHDLQEILALEEMVNQREQTIMALECEAQGYKHRMMSYGIIDGCEIEMSRNQSFDDGYDEYEYPSLKVNNINVNQEDPLGEADDIYVADDENYPPVDSPRGRVHLRSLDQRISLMEMNPSLDDGFSSAREKEVVSQSPRRQRHFRNNSRSHLGASKDDVFVESEMSCISKKVEHVSSYTENDDDNGKGGALDVGDEMSDRVYTIDSGHHHSGVTEQKVEAEGSDGNLVFSGEGMEHGDPDITKLYMRLQALEADRESMKEALLSMRTEKAQMVLLKELAQHLSKEVVPQRRLPLRKAAYTAGTLTFRPVFKWITSFVTWRRKARRSKYMYGMSTNTMGLQMLLETVPRSRKWRCLRSTEV